MTEQTVYLAGGCFWGTERYLKLIPGVLSTEVGYANGNRAQVSYEAVCKENTGHAEAVRVVFDADALPLGRLLSLFFDAIDPTSVNRQGGDVGTQYRTGVYYTDACQRPEAERAFAELQKKLGAPVAVELLPLRQYCKAEEYHQDYLEKNPGGYCHIGIAEFVRLAARLKKLDG